MNSTRPPYRAGKTTRPEEDWLGPLRARGVASVAQQLGLTSPRPRTLAPCHSCGAEKRGSEDKRGPIGIRRDDLGWRCHRCQAGGDAVTLAAWVITGQAKPPTWSTIKERLLGPSSAQTPVIKPRPTPKARTYARPPQDELLDLWKDIALPVSQDQELSDLLTARGLDPHRIAESDLARALPKQKKLPLWAKREGQFWNALGHRLLVPLFGPTGELESVHARDLSIGPAHTKGSFPTSFDIAGLVMAEGLGRLLLREASPPDWWEPIEDRVVIISEGVPDFLSWSSLYSESESLSAPAVFGVVAGAFCTAIADRIPSHLKIAVRTHLDEAGEKYAQAIIASLGARCSIYRLKQKEP